MKKIVKYVILSLALLLGICCVGILFLFFMPGKSLFNITYINSHTTITSQKYSSTLVQEIEVNSRAYKIEVIPTEEETVSLTAHSNSFGFVLAKNQEFNITSSLKNNVLTFNVTEPHGFATSNTSKITLKIPTDIAPSLTFSNLKAKTTINNPDIFINNLNFSTSKGSLSVSQAVILGDINLNINKGHVYFNENIVPSDNTVNLSLTSGSFKSPNSLWNEVNIDSNERGSIEFGECYKLKNSRKSDGGKVRFDKACYIDISASNTQIVVNEIFEDANVEFTKSGSVSIEKISGAASIKTNSGNIYIGDSYSTLSLSSQSGNINIAKARTQVSLTMHTGRAKVAFDENAESYNEHQSSRILNARIHNAHITATGVEHIGSIVDENTASSGGIKIYGNGSINISMNNVYGTNSIDGNNGSVRLVINKDSVYKLRTKTTTGNVRVNLTQISEYNGYTTKSLRTTNVNCTTTSHSLTATTEAGNLTILDTNFA